MKERETREWMRGVWRWDLIEGEVLCAKGKAGCARGSRGIFARRMCQQSACWNQSGSGEKPCDSGQQVWRIR